jgi:hypothetical protein
MRGPHKPKVVEILPEEVDRLGAGHSLADVVPHGRGPGDPRRRRRTPITTSIDCIKGVHWHCYKQNCVCDCHKRGA